MMIQMPHTQFRACWGTAPAPIDHRRAPIFEALSRAVERNLTSFACPGHKGGPGADPSLVGLLGAGVFAGDIWLNAGLFTETLRDAEALAADAWGADRALYLVNGSSSGNQALLLATLRPGDEVIVARDIHTSLLTALVMTGARPVYVTPRFHPLAGVSLGIHPDDVANALDDHPNVRLVALVRPNYFGIAADLAGIVRNAHSRGVPVYVDEAWGPHLSFHSALPPSAMECGADAAVTSAHKLLGSLSQGSLLMLRGPMLDHDRIAAAAAMTQSTSPLLPILASIDTARRQMALDGAALLDRAIALAGDARRRLLRLPGIDVLGGSRSDTTGFDATRLVIDVGGLGLTGYAVERILRDRFGIAPEMSDFANVICLVSIGNSHQSIDRLVAAFETLVEERGSAPQLAGGDQTCSLGKIIAAGSQVLTPREAFFAPARDLPLEAAAGEVAAEMIVPYPPGVPVITPGELITADKIDYLREGLARGMCLRGASDSSLETVRVVL